jgi:predicted phage gp36 major capsid-like protein
MADEVQVFYNHLITETSLMNDSVTALMARSGTLQGDDVGIENPAHRTALRLEMRRRFTALRATVEACTSDASDITERLRAISERYSDLDVELTGKEQP